MLGANKAQVIIRHVVYVGHCQVLAKKTKENKLTPARSWMRNCNPFSKREMCLTSFWSPEGLGFLTCKQRGMSMTPFTSVSEQEISLFRKKKVGEPTRESNWEISASFQSFRFLFFATLQSLTLVVPGSPREGPWP